MLFFRSLSYLHDRKTVTESDCELLSGLSPVSNRHRPFTTDSGIGQINEFFECRIRRAISLFFVILRTWRVVFDRIGGKSKLNFFVWHSLIYSLNHHRQAILSYWRKFCPCAPSSLVTSCRHGATIGTICGMLEREYSSCLVPSPWWHCTLSWNGVGTGSDAHGSCSLRVENKASMHINCHIKTQRPIATGFLHSLSVTRQPIFIIS